MVTAPLRLRVMAALLAVGSLALVGCKQGIGDRCEQNTDCASGICGDGADMASAAGKQCVAVVGGGAAGSSGAAGAGGSAGATGGSYGTDAAADASEEHAEAGAETRGQEASDASDAPDATEAGAD